MALTLDDLPQVRGRLKLNAPLAPLTWFQVGGPAAFLFKPADTQDLQQFLQTYSLDVPLYVLGVGSNILIRDGGLQAGVLRLGAAFAQVSIEGTRVRAGAGALDRTVAKTAAAAGLGGLAFLSGIPGSIGGALRMNAGAYGQEVKDCLIEATILLPNGELQTWPAERFAFQYRQSDLPQDAVVIEALFQAQPMPVVEAEAAIDKIQQDREASQPTKGRTGGSTFKNPPGHKAWQLIEAAGFRGKRLGGAQVSDKHCNFLLNTGTATAAELEELGEQVRAAVLAQSGINLEWEIKRIGQP